MRSGLLLAAVLTIVSLALPMGALSVAHLPMAPHAGVSKVVAPYAAEPKAGPRPIAPHASVPTTTSAGVPTPRLGAFSLPGPHPAAWGTAGTPPGAEALNALLPATASGGNPANGTEPWQNRFCSGLWPYGFNDSASQALYWDGCYGHDEPGIESYSPLAGSGGNVSWQVTLPIDRNSTANQSNLYVAIWFGLTLNDPLAYEHQCFLELQFYPDQTFTNGPGLPNPAWTVNGAWIGAAVAWQIESATGYEDPCFYQPLYNGSATGGSSFFNMSQGDQISVTFSGWENNPNGENLTITDVTTGTSSYVTLWDYAGNFPLNPSYRTNTYENGLEWTPGGEYPAVFAFENGHAGNPNWPASNPYGGCSPGKPPASAFFPSVPCPSYDPGSWANDTLVPWHISSPTFFNAQSSDAAPSQVAFTQDFGGVGAISDIGQGACDGQLGSAWCSYPWYSYSCAAHAFEFGAVDYPGVSEDFGQYNEYSPVLEFNGQGFGYFPPTNFSMPTCGAPSYNVTVGPNGLPGGSVYFLSQADSVPTNVSGLLPGNYSIYPVAPAGGYFQDWTTSGGAHILGSSTDPWATLVVEANGSVTAWFTVTPSMTNVTFDGAGDPAGAHIVVSQARTYTGGIPLAVLPIGASISLPIGVYAVQGVPGVGANFTSWMVDDGAASIAADQFPFTWLDVFSNGGSANITVNFTASVAWSYEYLWPAGGGSITVNGTSYSTITTISLPVGGWSMLATPDPGWAFAGWEYGTNAVMTDFAQATVATFEESPWYSPTYILALFAPVTVYNVTLNDTPVAGGTSGFFGPDGGMPSGSVVGSFPGTYTLYAFPSPGYNFTGWEVDNGSAAWIAPLTSSVTTLELNASVTITAEFVNASTGTVVLTMVPSGVGDVLLDGSLYYANSTITGLTNGTYALDAFSFANYYFAGFTANGSGSIVFSPFAGELLNFSAWPATTANVTAWFYPLPPPPPAGTPLTFVATSPGVSATIGSTSVGTGETLWLAPGLYNVSLSIDTTNLSFDGWVATPGLSVWSPSVPDTVVDVSVPGTLTAVIGPFAVGAPSVAPNPGEVGVAMTLNGSAVGSGPFTYSWLNLPTGCASANSGLLACTPTAAGSFPVQLSATDTLGSVGLSPIVTVTVEATLAVVSLTATPAAVDVGIATTIATTVAGGVGALSYNYTSLPAGCSGTAASFACSPTAAGTATLAVTVTDGLAVEAQGTGSVTVNPLPSVSAFTASPSTTDVGVATDLTVTVAGGTAPFAYAYTNLPAGCASANAATLHCVPTAAGTSLVVVTVTDADGITATQDVSVSVNSAPSVGSFTASRSAVDVGLATVLTATASGGTGTLFYAFAGLPAGCSTANTLSLACTPTAAGSASVTFTATDVVGGSGSSALTLTVNPEPSITAASFSPGSVDTGSATTLTVTAAGGTGALTYSYGALPSGCSSSNTATLACTPSASGTFTVTVTVTDTLGAADNASATLTVNTAASSGLFGLAGATGYAVLGVIILVVVIVLALLLMRMRRPKPRPASPPSETTTPPETGGTGAS